MRIGKRLAALAMALVLCCGCLAAPAAAVESRGLDNAAHIVSDFWDLMARTVNPIYAIIAGYLEGSKTPETATEEDWKNAYTQYNQNIQNNYYTTIIDSSGAGLIPLTGWRHVCGTDEEPGHTGHSLTNIVVDPMSPSITAYSTSEVSSSDLWLDFSVPVMGDYQLILPSSICLVLASAVSPSIRGPGLSFPPLSGYVGSVFSSVPTETLWVKYQLTFKKKYTASYVVDFVSSGPVYLKALRLFPSTDSSVGADSRVGTFSGNFGYYGDNGEMVFAENISIINETNNTYYNPVTGDTSTINEWSYDYSDRSYNVKLDTGDTVNVVYGDENIVIRQGDTVYNIYYTVPSTPEPTPPPSPTPSPTPTPSSSLPPTDPPGPTEPGEKPDTSGWGILDFLKGIFDFLWGIVKAIGETIMNVLKALFLPKEESVTKVQDLMDEKLPFISDLQTFGDDFYGALVNPVARVRSAAQFTSVIDVGNKTSGVSYGDAQADVLDVSWYLEYKDTVDDIIEGVAWLAFLWNLYGALPSIIHGGASGVHTTAQILKWKDEHDP